MKKLAITSLLVGLFVLSSYSSAFATTSSNLSISPNNVKPGSEVSVLGGGFKPGASVSVSFDGSGVKSLTADSAGDIAFSQKLPESLKAGQHSFTAEGDSGSKISSEPYSGFDRHAAVGSVNMKEEKTVVKGEEVKPTTTTIPTVVKGEVAKPAPAPARTELPFTGGLPLLIGFGAGIALIATGYKLRK
jgi:hypothetical protein